MENQGLHPFTQEAIRLAHRDEYEGRSHTAGEERNNLERSYATSLRESEWGFITGILRKEIAKSQALIKRSRSYPSETIKSEMTISRHKEHISEIERMISAIEENAF